MKDNGETIVLNVMGSTFTLTREELSNADFDEDTRTVLAHTAEGDLPLELDAEEAGNVMMWRSYNPPEVAHA